MRTWNVFSWLARGRRRAVVGSMMVLGLSVGVAWAATESADDVAARAEKVAQSALVPHPTLGGPKDFGASSEPAPLGSLRPMYSVTDVTVKGGVSDFSLMRHYSSTDDTWHGEITDLKGEPFGVAPLSGGTTGKALRWWHSLYSFVKTRYPTCSPQQVSDGTCDPSVPYYVVRDTSGQRHEFVMCEPQYPATSCMAVNTEDPSLKLEQDGGFVLHTPEGRYHYRTQVGDTYLLSYVEDAQYDEQGSCQGTGTGPLTCRRRVTLSYAAPSACQGTTVDSGQLFVDEAVTGSGAKLKFNYGVVAKRGGAAGESECVLLSVGLEGTDGAPAQTVVSYEYADGSSGLLSAAYHPETQLRTTYEYTLGGQRAWVVRQDGKLVTQELLDPDRGHLLQDTGPDRSYAVTAENNRVGTVVDLCPPGVFGPESLLEQTTSSCKPTQWQYFKDTQASPGDGLGGTVTLNRSFLLSHYDHQGPLLMERTVSCEPTSGSCVGTPDADWKWEIAKLSYSDTQKREVPKAERDSNGSWKAYGYQIPLDGSGAKNYMAPPELTTILSGATDDTGTGALQTQYYGYTYGPAHEQLVKWTSMDSVLAKDPELTPQSTTSFTYSSTNRLQSVIKEGFTRVFDGTNWVQQERFVGTFFFTAHQCQGGASADPLGRTLEVHGPCLVTGFNAQDCSGTGPVPIVRYAYYPATELGSRANRLRSKTLVTHEVPTSCQQAEGLTTTYDAYDARGNVLASTGPNGLQTTYVYEGERLVQSSAGGVTTQYGFDDGATHGDYIHHPEGSYEVLCYRTGTPTSACAGGTLTDKLQWKAKSATANGATWTEKVVYTYRAGALASETYLDATGAVRRTRRYEADPLGHSTFEAWGSGAGSYASTALFDAEGNRKGLGQPYNTSQGATTPPPFCGGPGTSTSTNSFLCTQFAYDRLNRLMNMVEAPGTASLTSKTCIGYDGQGNVSRVKTGCADNTAQGDCGSCSQPELSYQHDDFGNLVSVTAPWTDDGSGGSGTTNFEYDAAGNLVRRQTPAMAAGPNPAWIEYTYDNLGRLEEARQVSAASSQTLFSMRYDQSVAPPEGCPSLATSHTLGRLQVRTDSFGDTWFEYDAWGRVTGTYRRRGGSAPPRTQACTGGTANEVLNSQSTYSPDGRLVAETYPHGRAVRYRYYPAGSGQEDRVESIEVDTYASDGSGGLTASSRTLLRNVRWEPFGGVRAYEVVAPLAASGQEVASIEYLLGGDNTPATSCNASRPGSGDVSGHLRGLWVSGAGLSSSESSRTGDIFRRTYSWKGDQLAQEDTCVLDSSAAAPQSVLYGYDERLRLTNVTRPARQYSTRGGTVGRRLYSYDRRGNRLSGSGVAGETEDCWDFQLTSGTGAHVDWLMERQSLGTRCTQPGQNVCPGPSLYSQSFSYDRDGRVTRKAWPADSSGSAYALDFTLDEDLDPNTPNHAAVGMVYRSVSAGGSVYEYFYDANGRRRLKRYPLGAEDEYFYDGDKLLEDRGNSSVQTATPEAYTLDEYLWLDGKPVALIKSKFDASWNRQADLAGDCGRNGESAPCGVYFLVTDYLGKPVLMLDSARRVSGMAEYEPFGHINRVRYLGDTGHPYANNARSVLGYFNQPAPSAAMRVQLRARYALVDTEEGADYAYLSDQYGTELTTVDGGSTRVSGPSQGPRSTGWVEVPQENGQGRVHARFFSNAAVNSKGVVLEGYEYRRFQQGASPVWTPLRFPGQYYDAETDLFENWHRYYDPALGRYLGPDPATFQTASHLKHARGGKTLPGYAYAYNNPLRSIDPTGLEPPPGVMDQRAGAAYDAVNTCQKGGKAACALVATAAVITAAAAVASAALVAIVAPHAAATATIATGTTAEPVANKAAPIVDEVVEKASSASVQMYGPFHRLQSAVDTARVQMSGILGGEAPRNGFGSFVSVKAYPGALPNGADGMTFMTSVAPSSVDAQVRWLLGDPGVLSGTINEADAAFIPVGIVNSSMGGL